MVDSSVLAIGLMVIFAGFGVFLLPSYSYITRRLERGYPEVLSKIDPKGFRRWHAPSQFKFNSYIRSGQYMKDLHPDFSSFITKYKVIYRMYLFVFILAMVAVGANSTLSSP